MDNKNTFILSGSVLVAALVVAGALIYNAGTRSLKEVIPNNVPEAGDLEALKPVTDKDHLRGNLNAPVKIITFEDTECPFCKRFHITMQQIVKKYGDQVVWVYRHFPLESLHSQARKEANALECVAALGGNNAFWIMLDKVFETTPSNNGLDLSLVPALAVQSGVNQSQFQKCWDENKYDQIVSDQLADATAVGGQGTPFSIVIGKDGKKYPVNGALPYEPVKAVVEQASR